jgi:uncharacterized protein YegJ (DUF2314 family)
MSESRVVMFDNADPAMQAAYEAARATFRHFWRELAWERRRIVPGLSMSAVKAPFYDEARRGTSPKDAPEAEQMWVGEVGFDGRAVSGVLLNAPRWLTSVREGDRVRVALGQLSDWMFVIDGEVYGAFTVNLMRSRMSPGERREHDAAWGLDFGDPAAVRIAYQQPPGVAPQEHPMSEGMAEKLAEALAQDSAMLRHTSEDGWTLLHHEALAGNSATVRVLLDNGADVNAVTGHGMTPLALARSLGWDAVTALLEGRGAK